MYSFHEAPLRFIKSYLVNLKKYVFSIKKEAVVKWEVSQGSVLWPVVFLINILVNDLPLAFKSKIILYADDTSFINTIKSIDNDEIIVNKTLDLDVTATWFDIIGFQLNKENFRI